MNFTKIIKMQIKLDKNIEKEYAKLGEDLTSRKIVALLVEVGEFANEIKSFKYWKKDKTINRDKMLEEFVDGIHFFLSLVWKSGASPIVEPLIISKHQSNQLLVLFEEISKLNTTFTKQQIKKSFELFLGLAELTGITEAEVLKFYIKKNKINYERLAAGY